MAVCWSGIVFKKKEAVAGGLRPNDGLELTKARELVACRHAVFDRQPVLKPLIERSNASNSPVEIRFVVLGTCQRREQVVHLSRSNGDLVSSDAYPMGTPISVNRWHLVSSITIIAYYSSNVK